MSSIALRHKQRALERHARNELASAEAENTKTVASGSSTPAGKMKLKHQQEVALSELDNDLKRLSELESVADKVALKKTELLPKYLPIVQAYRDSGQNRPFEMLAYMIIWLIDVEDIEIALDWAKFSIEQQQHMPKHFKRDMPTYAAEEICTWAERQFKADASASPYLDEVAALIMTKQWVVPQVIVLNKIFKQMGLYAEKDNNWQLAVDWYEECETVNPGKSGIKTRLKAAKERLAA